VPVEIVGVASGVGKAKGKSCLRRADKPEAAKHLATRIVAVVETLRLHPNSGRAGAEPGIRELVIGGTPYSILYRVRGQRVIISTIWHSAQEDVAKEKRPIQKVEWAQRRMRTTDERCV